MAVDVGAVSTVRNQHRCGGAKGKDGGGKPRHWTVGQRKEENENPMEPTWGQEGKETGPEARCWGSDSGRGVMDKKGYGDGGKGGCAGLALRKPIGHHETNNDIGEQKMGEAVLWGVWATAANQVRIPWRTRKVRGNEQCGWKRIRVDTRVARPRP